MVLSMETRELFLASIDILLATSNIPLTSREYLILSMWISLCNEAIHVRLIEQA
jgi:hypothetical protein